MLRHLNRFVGTSRLPIVGKNGTLLTSTRGKNTSFTKFPNFARNTLYDARLEKDSCGVGLVAHMKKQASRQIVLDANENNINIAMLYSLGINKTKQTNPFFHQIVRWA